MEVETMSEQASQPRLKRVHCFYCDCVDQLITEEGAVREAGDGRRARGWYYNKMLHKRNRGKKPRTRVVRGCR